MNTQSSKSIVLTRTSYGESDRVIKVITQNGTKVALMAKGVRKLKSKLAGGIELFCECQLVYVGGQGKMGTLVSARVDKQYGNIVKDIDRTMFGYEILKLINKITEDDQIAEYYELLAISLASLNTLELNVNLIKVWVYYKLLDLTGHQPNSQLDASGNELQESYSYDFDVSSMSLTQASAGRYGSRHIKFLRVVEQSKRPTALSRVSGTERVASDLADLLSQMIKFNL